MRNPAAVLTVTALVSALKGGGAQGTWSAQNLFPVGSTLSLGEQATRYRVIGSGDSAFPVNTHASLADLAANGTVLAIDKSECT